MRKRGVGLQYTQTRAGNPALVWRKNLREFDRMRLKIIVPVLLLSVASLVVMLLGRPGRRDAALHDSATSVAIPITNNTTEADPDADKVDEAKPSPTNQAGLAFAEESHGEHVSRRTAELMDLAMSDDSISLNTILSELNNPDAEIRQAAITASVQFKSADAIPALQDAYTRADDPEEKISIRKAIEFLAPASAPNSVTVAN